MTHTAILLAAGYSSRMGTLKALLPWNGIPLIEYQIRELLKTSFTSIVVVLGHEAESIKKIVENYPVETIFNPNYADGKTSSIKAGINGSLHGNKSNLIVSVDTPIDARIVENMVELLILSNSKIVIPVYSGKRGHPILIDASLRNDILSITEENYGLKGLLAKHQQTIGELEVNEEQVLYNLNTKMDYEFLKNKFERRS